MLAAFSRVDLNRYPPFGLQKGREEQENRAMTKSLGSRPSVPRTTHARLDVITPQAGLFRVVPDNPRSRPTAPLDGYRYQVEHDGMMIGFRSVAQLTATDWKFFVSVCALAGLDGQRFDGTAADPPLPLLWSGFGSEGIAASRAALRLRTTAYAVLAELGLTDGGDNRRRLTEALIRLSVVRQFLWKGSRVVSGANLLSFAHDEASGELLVGLSPQVARTALGESKQHTRVSLEEVRRLFHPAALIIHAALSARLRVGDSRSATYHLDTLGELAYGPTAHPATRRSRRRSLRRALGELGQLPGWSCALKGHLVSIRRLSGAEATTRRTAHALPSDCARFAVEVCTPLSS
jgi:hypothetical protein